MLAKGRLRSLYTDFTLDKLGGQGQDDVSDQG